MSPRGCVVFTAADPAGPWSDGTTIEGIDGIDPDLAWDDDGTAYVTFSGLYTSGERAGQHLGIQQVRVDLTAGKALEEPRSLWSGTGLKFPEAPHLYRRGGYWYLMIAEGGTERGHSVSVARGPLRRARSRATRPTRCSAPAARAARCKTPGTPTWSPPPTAVTRWSCSACDRSARSSRSRRLAGKRSSPR